MPNLNDIPVEILQRIFKYVEESIRYKKSWMMQYQLVCKSWNLAAKLCLYNFVDLSSNKDSDRFLRCMENSSAGQFTRTICINTRYMKYGTEKFYIRELAKVLPNIYHVTGVLKNYSSFRTLTTNASIYWRDIKELTCPFPTIREDKYIKYHNMLLNFRHSLTHMHLPYQTPSNPNVKEFFQRLPEFTKLTHLTADEANLRWPLMDYDEILQRCPNLIYLKINSYFRNRVPPPISYILSLQPYKNIKTLHACLPYSKPNVEYIMHKFPSVQNLILEFSPYFTLSTRRGRKQLYACIDDRFMKYLSLVQRNEINGIKSFCFLEAYLKFTSNIHLCFETKQCLHPQLVLQQTNMARMCFEKCGPTKMILVDILKRHPHNITSCTLNFEFKSSESTLWIEYIFTICKQMKMFHYLTSAHFCSSSKAVIDANVPLNLTLETLTLKVLTIERGSLATYLRLLPSVRHVTINSASPSMDEVKSIVNMLLDSFNDVRLNTGSPQSHYSGVVDVFGKKALLEIYDGLSDKTRYLVDIEHENGARRE